MPTIRVLVANRPRLMQEMVLATIADEPDIDVVGVSENESVITELVERTKPDFLIVGLDQSEVGPAFCSFLLGRYPAMKILAVGSEKNQCVFYWAFVNIRSKILETTDHSLLDTLRRPFDLVQP